ncbi:hypothetical protein Taro_026009 [Colocasia esculenta]|uniref:Ubiquitin-like protease family profile domain-containing protein n=1 Tax=Colocasia esculenta TaxID=4460 RepID=A0A843VJA9_COLES|nr:hypothetical protein [Colocasia esculenta]
MRNEFYSTTRDFRVCKKTFLQQVPLPPSYLLPLSFSLSFSFSLSISQLISVHRTTSLPLPSVPRSSIPSIGHPISLSVSLTSQSPPPHPPPLLRVGLPSRHHTASVGFPSQRHPTFIGLPILSSESTPQLSSFPYYKFNASQQKKMLTWVKDKEVFLKKYSFVPICMGHWSLVILCHEEEDDLPFIMLVDSLHSIDPTKLVRPIQRFFKDIYATKNKTVIADAMSSIDISVPSVPQQINGTECELFVLYYIYHFIQNDPPSFSLDDYPFFTKLQVVKITQPSSSSSSSIATADDTYSQIELDDT